MSHYDAAFQAGYNDCLRSFASGATSLSSPSDFKPPTELREAYEAGWQKAAQEHSTRLAKRERRGDILIQLLIGVVLLVGGAAFTFFTVTSGGGAVIIFYGAMVTGIGLIIKAVVAAIEGREIDPHFVE